jgi:hypothetical protein
MNDDRQSRQIKGSGRTYEDNPYTITICARFDLFTDLFTNLYVEVNRFSLLLSSLGHRALGEKLKSRRYLNWRKPIQMLRENVYVTSRGRYCSHHPAITYLSAEAASLSLPHSTYGLDVLVRIGYQRDYRRMPYSQIQEALPAHIRVSERHLSNLYREYLALLACAERLDVDKLKSAAAKYGGLILSVDGLEPEGGQPQLWVVREVLTGTLLAAGWLPRVDETTLTEFLAPVKRWICRGWPP